MDMPLTSDAIARYRETALKRREQERAALARRRQEALADARRAARLLREQYGASRVVVFGSVAREVGFTRWSDVDIAAWGIAAEDTFRAIGAVMSMDSTIPVNLVDINTASPALRSTIEREGIEL